jgi:hypothetical protein
VRRWITAWTRRLSARSKPRLRQASEELGQLTQKYEIGLTWSEQHPAKRRNRVSASARRANERHPSRHVRHVAAAATNVANRWCGGTGTLRMVGSPTRRNKGFRQARRRANERHPLRHVRPRCARSAHRDQCRHPVVRARLKVKPAAAGPVRQNTPQKVATTGTISLASGRHSRDEWCAKEPHDQLSAYLIQQVPRATSPPGSTGRQSLRPQPARPPRPDAYAARDRPATGGAARNRRPSQFPP